MMQRYSLFSLFAFLLLIATSSVAQTPFTHVKAYLSGQQQALPVVTTANGEVTLRVMNEGEDDASIVVTGSFSGLSSPVLASLQGGAHLHVDFPGRNDEIIQPLVIDFDDDSLGGRFLAESNTFPLPAEMVDLDLGRLYLNVHTRNHPGGEIRGIFGDVDNEQYFTNLFGSNEVPSVLSSGYGALWFDYDPIDSVLFVSGSYQGMSSEESGRIDEGVHLHVGLPGENGPIVIPLDPIADTDRPEAARIEDSYKLTLDQVTALRQGRMYANVHTKKFPMGEIRGQVLPVADVVFRVHLSGANEWPVVTTRASGQVLAHLKGDSVRLVGSFGNLSTPVLTSLDGGAHLHTGWAGQNGGITITLDADLSDDEMSGAFMLADNGYELDDDQLEQMIQRGIYLNIHTTAHPSGELRGQVLPESQAVFTAFLNGNQQIPSVTTTGRGMVKVELIGTKITASGSFSDLTSDLRTEIAGGAHLHAGYPGQSGPVVYPLTAATDDADDARNSRFLPMANTFMIGEGGVDTLMRRFFYTNIHSDDHQGGEIRGSVLAEAESYFLAPLSGASEPQGVPTGATGMVAAEVVDTNVVLVGSFMDLESDFAADVAGGMHLHQAIAGTNGGILVGINTEIMDDDRSGVILADSNHLMLRDSQLMAMMDRLVYANVHTEDYQGGEIRGQLLPLAGSYFHTTFSGMNATNSVITTAQGGLKLELIDTTLMLSGSVTDLQGDYDPSIGSHLHLAPAGQNGGIVIPLKGIADDDLKRVSFPVDSNTYELVDSLVVALRTGRLYANIHTTTVPSGEARGQLRSELNLPPAASMILSPMDGDSLSITGNNTDTFRVSYEPVMDMDGDTVIYVWQLATDADFDSVIFAANTGRDTFFMTDLGTIDTLLGANDVMKNDTVTLYHRVLASDGSNHRPSEGASITLNRGDLVGSRDYLPKGFAAVTFPNPLQRGQSGTYRITTQEAFRGRLLLYSAIGQLQREIMVDAQPGDQPIDLRSAALTPGQYFITLRHESGQLIHTSRLVVQ